ncbi:hypothetical protein [Agromyces sp. NPDC049794]|uniref:hypothetical protein n=1 Tax=unclassified Agromyces TaxID=2639701 RepID=UPI0033C560CB
MRTQVLAAAALVFTLSLSACASPAYDQDTAQELREHIVVISAASAAGDWHGALAGLEVMATELSEARRAGKVDQQRFDTIALAMERVRLDLEVAIAAAATEVEQQRLLEEQARLQEQINQLQNQGSGGESNTKDESDKKGESDKKEEKKDEGNKGKGEGQGQGEGQGESQKKD